jgi:hypothetical protein
MENHKYKVGQSVELRARIGAWLPPGAFSIVRQLPASGRENQYRLKSSNDGHERVAAESELASPAVV